MNKRRLFSKKIYRKYFFIFSIIFVSGFFFVSSVKAATFYLKPSASEVYVGDLATVSLFINTQDKTINNAEAIIQFPPDLVEVLSVSSKSSIFSLWVEQPSFSNTNGTISFNGGVPNPGYAGKSGQVLTINLRTKQVGEATFLYSGAAIRENDGLGTDILNGQSSATISIIGVAAEPEIPPTSEVTPPALKPGDITPRIYSETYPNQNNWYSEKDGIMTWKVPVNTKSVQTALDSFSKTVPSVTYAPPINQKSISISEGTWYFHLRYSVDNKWTPIAHYKIRIDTTPPEDLSIIVDQTNKCAPVLSLKASDALSGIGYYNIFIDNLPAIKVLAKDAESPISIPQLGTGNHQVTVTAFDRAGNTKVASTAIEIEQAPAPVIFSRDSNIKVGESLKITGKADQPKALVKVIFKSASGNEVTYDVVTNENGEFSFLSDPINLPGDYQVWIYQSGCNNQNGQATEKYKFTVEIPVVIESCHCPAKVSCAKYLILAFVLGMILSALVSYGLYKYITLKKRIRRWLRNLTRF